MKYLMLDIGAGTMDVLYFDSETGVQYKSVVMSPVLSLAEKVSRISWDLIITGNEMGGGAISNILIEHARNNEVLMSASSAVTLNHDLEKVRSWGIKVVNNDEAEDIKKNKMYNHIEINDLEIDRMKRMIEVMGVPFSFDVVGLCAQDHGVPPAGVSHLDYRHNLFKEKLDKSPFPHEMLFKNDEIPKQMNRLLSLGNKAKELPAGEIYVNGQRYGGYTGGVSGPVSHRKRQDHRT